MSKYRNNLLQSGKHVFLTDGGLETTLLFDKGFELPEFAAFTLLESEKGAAALREYYLPYIALAKRFGFGFILESPTWRASEYWGNKLGYSSKDLEYFNHKAIELLVGLRMEHEDATTAMVISGCIGPKGDGYNALKKMSVQEAELYHSVQIGILNRTEADLVSAFTVNYVEEAIGIALAARKISVPLVISFTLETDGRLPSGQALGSAIIQVDRNTDSYPAYYMINCAHPTHFWHVLKNNEGWTARIKGIRANASTKTHAELDNSDQIDAGDPSDLGESYVDLKNLLPWLNIYGGCCGTDHIHIEMICNRVGHIA